MTSTHKLKQVQRANLYILKTFDRCCREAGCGYFLDSGTLLGAVRHNGFIPWDDDLDVVMMRADYEKFKAYCQGGNLPDGFELTNTGGIHGFFFDFIPRFTLQQSRMHRESEADRQFQNEQNRLCADIFILDRMPENPLLFALTMLFLKIFYLLAMGHRGVLKPKVRNFAMSAVSFAGGLLPLPLIFRLRKLLLRTAGKTGEEMLTASNYVVEEMGTKYLTRWFVPVPHVFEDTSFPVPAGASEILKRLYGDYMKYPPEEKRIPEHIDSCAVIPEGVL